MNKTIKKILALGTGSIMLGLTFAAAAHAATLADYPAPFKNGGDTVVVYGVAGTSDDSSGPPQSRGPTWKYRVSPMTIQGNS